MPTVTKEKSLEPTSGAGAGWAAAKVAIAFGVPAALAAVIGLLLMPPRTAAEFVARTVCTVLSSFMFGPLVAIWIMTQWPGVLEQAVRLAAFLGLADDMHRLIGMLYVMGPCMLLAGLPAWWVLGAWMRWAKRMQDRGIPFWVREIKEKVIGK
ncbi:hypothetical protein [Alcaligenes sp. WGS1538]|uniref:hypothetical protein n=1 Tax=Alcaligenes sp. WGS1538 TaxID=3366811 RepID=UPI00372D33F7